MRKTEICRISAMTMRGGQPSPHQENQWSPSIARSRHSLAPAFFFLVHAALLAFCGWIKSWWNEPLGIDGFVLFVALSFIIQLFSPPTKADEPLALSVKIQVSLAVSVPAIKGVR
jgi:hypothetical protein